LFFFPTFLSPISCCHHMCMHASSHVCVLAYYCKTRCWSTCKKARKKTASALKRTANRPATPPPSTRVLTCLFTPNGAYSLFYKLLPQIQFAEHYSSIATLPKNASSLTLFFCSRHFSGTLRKGLGGSVEGLCGFCRKKQHRGGRVMIPGATAAILVYSSSRLR